MGADACLEMATRYGYQIQGKGRWMSITLKKPKKKKGGGAKKKDKKTLVREREDSEEDVDDADDNDNARDDVEVCVLFVLIVSIAEFVAVFWYIEETETTRTSARTGYRS
jgi:hypothetical protein